MAGTQPSNRGSRLWKNKAEFFRPFRSATSAAPRENDDPVLYDPEQGGVPLQDPDIQELNTALQILVDVFPDVDPEVFREMLPRVSPESRTQLVADHLLGKKRTQYVRGRTRSKATDTVAGNRRPALRSEEKFRAKEYEVAVRDVFYQEFKNLSKSAIRAVMAEQNNSYTMARPVLQQLAARSWRFSLSTLWSKRNPAAAVKDHPFVIWQPNVLSNGPSTPFVRRTRSVLLDQELYQLFVQPVVVRQRKELVQADYEYASTLNEADAEEADALFECECCYDTLPFERMTACDEDCHYLCFSCVNRAVREALYGQGWQKTADLNRSTIRCLSPSASDCTGIIPPSLVRQALSLEANQSSDMWQEFEARLAVETLRASSLPLQHCPFCDYAEVLETLPFNIKTWREILHCVDRKLPPTTLPFILITLISIMVLAAPILLIIVSVWFVLQLFPGFGSPVFSSWERVSKRRRGLQFRCLKPSCETVSCTRCASRWQDPHTCFDNESTSLRTAIELSATAAVKRTCPRCLLSFVKSSGCNKLVCNCGYTMCYICRQEITAEEGYGHFCQHFRPTGGRCAECERCDLYGDEDEDEAIQAATLAAERAWREKEGVGEEKSATSQLFIETIAARTEKLTWYEKVLDAIVDVLAV